ncbi:MAG: T9SS type A sorting domain-containing protein [Ignavibacteriae bacterium]|nr:T9SS type A sorting domain-containing protein [Ignavibacteriota bacterium]
MVILDTPLLKGKEYHYAISAYYYNENSGEHPKTIESYWETENITFQEDVSGLAYGDTLKVEINSDGINEILVDPIIVNPLELTNHTYTVTFQNIDNIPFWDLTDVTLDSVILKHQELVINRHSLNSYYSLPVITNVNVVDGLLLQVYRKYRALGYFEYDGIAVTKYNGEILENPYRFGGLGWSYNQSFAINAVDHYNIEDIYISTKYLLPYDYKIRFTENENFGIDYWDNNKVISVPFELWNIGIDTPNDFSDDTRMIPFIKMQKDTSYWSINSSQEIGHVFMESYLKPASDWIYWMKPDIESGGYNSFENICKTVGIGGDYDTTMDDSPQGFYTDFQGGFNYVMGNMIIVDSDEDGNPPPAGTTIRFSTLKPVSEDISFTFTSVKPTEKISPNKYELFQNYPNPFNPNTTIRFYLPEDGNIKLTLFNILGQKVKEILNKDMLAGKYEVPLDGSNLASGVYIYRLDSGNQVETCKMILLK